MKNLYLNSKFTHSKMRVILGLSFLMLIVIALLSYSTFSQMAAEIQDSISLMLAQLDPIQISWLAFIIAGLGYYQYMRIREKRKTERMRMTLASDLHDDLGSILNSVNIYTELALIKGEALYLHKIKESTQEAITGIRNIIWQLDDKDASFSNLIKRIECFTSFLCSAKQIRFKVEIAKEAFQYTLEEQEKRNLYMIIKEAINNSVKYASAADIELQITLEKGKPIIEIRDNGKGYNQSCNTKGCGISNMKQRAACIRYQINIKSNSGTVVRLQKK